MKLTKTGSAALLLAFGVASAQDVVVEDRDERRSTAGIVAMDTLYGGLTGAAVSGGIIGYRMVVQDQDDYDWGPVLATGVGIGLAAGLVWGIVDAASQPRYAIDAMPVTDGQAYRETHRGDLSGISIVTLKMGTW